MHVQHPVTQAVGHQLQRARTEQIECVTRAGEIQIRARILRMQPVVTGVIDPAKAQRRAEMIAFGGMIVNDVENHFHTASVKVAHHRFELRDLFAHLATTGVLRVRREKSDRVVAPIILETAID